MNTRKAFILIFAVAVLPLFGEIAISVDGGKATVDKAYVLRVAEKVMMQKNNMQGMDESTEQRILRDVILDMEFWMLVLIEGADRNLPPSSVSMDGYPEFCKTSQYGNLDRDTQQMAYLGNVVGQKLLELDGINTTSDQLRDVFLARYEKKHQVEISDYTSWKVNRNRFRLVQDSKYNAIEHELREDAGFFKKAIYYFHRYTIRYYVLFLRWYILKAEAVVSGMENKGGASLTKWTRISLLYILPYLFHVGLVLLEMKLRQRCIGCLGLFIRAAVYAGISTILFYFGMSPWSLFVVVVGIPLAIYFAPTVFDTMTSRTLYKLDEYGHSAPSGEAYTLDGEKVSINPQDVVYNEKYTEPINVHRIPSE